MVNALGRVSGAYAPRRQGLVRDSSGFLTLQAIFWLDRGSLKISSQ